MRRNSNTLLASAMALLSIAGWSAEPGGQETADAAAKASTGQPSIIAPVLVSRPTIAHPDLSREARVYVQFLVSAEGKPVEMAVMQERGFHTQVFREAALNYVRGMRFNPATREGVPVVHGPLVQPITFGIGLSREEQGVTPSFRRELNKVGKFLEDGDYAGAHFHAEWMLREKVKLGFEYAVLQAQLAHTLAAVGRLDEALAAARGATSRSTSESPGYRIGEPPPVNDESRYLLPKEVIVPLLDLRMRLLAQRGELLGALKTYNELAGLQQLGADHPLTVLEARLIELLGSGKALAFQGEVQDNAEFWSHELFHPRFTTSNVQGKLGVVHLHCRGLFEEFEHELDRIWTVPPGSEGCVVEFYGEPGARIELVELPAD